MRAQAHLEHSAVAAAIFIFVKSAQEPEAARAASDLEQVRSGHTEPIGECRRRAAGFSAGSWLLLPAGSMPAEPPAALQQPFLGDPVVDLTRV